MQKIKKNEKNYLTKINLAKVGVVTIAALALVGNSVAFAQPAKVNPVVTVTPVAGSLLHGTETFAINVTEGAHLLASAVNRKVWVYLYNAAGAQKSQGASVDLSSGTGTFIVDTTKIDNGDSWLDVGQVEIATAISRTAIPISKIISLITRRRS